MKKLSLRQKLHLLSRARYQAKKINRQSKSPGISQLTYHPNITRQVGYLPKEAKWFTKEPPQYFNLQFENCESVIGYVNEIKKAGSRKWNILINLVNVVDLREGAIAMLLSVMQEIQYSVVISGILPRDTKARLTLEMSGFFKIASVKGPRPNHLSENIMRTGKKGDLPHFLGDDIKTAMGTVWGIKGRNPYLRTEIFEMMRNSCDHAFQSHKEVRWHFSISHDISNNIVKFSFVDNGNGILDTMKTPLKKVLSFFKDNTDLLETAFKDGIESRTKLSWRGKGLPTIFENVTEGLIKNFLVISNNVFLHFDSKDRNNIEINRKILPAQYRGTYYYWEIDTTCVRACFK
jgi:hypothetical protein